MRVKFFALWTNASNQGEVAGLNMIEIKTKASKTFAMNSISFFGLQIISAGIINNSKANGVFVDSAKNKLRELNIFNDNLIGFVLINDNQRAGIYTSLINDKTKLSTLTYDITSKDIGFNVYPVDEITKKIWDYNGGY